MRQAYDYWQDQPGFFSFSNQSQFTSEKSQNHMRNMLPHRYSEFISQIIQKVKIKHTYISSCHQPPYWFLNNTKAIRRSKATLWSMEYCSIGYSIHFNEWYWFLNQHSDEIDVCRHWFAFILGRMQIKLQIKCQREDSKLSFQVFTVKLKILLLNNVFRIITRIHIYFINSNC